MLRQVLLIMSGIDDDGDSLVAELGGIDFSGDGKVINLAIVGSSQYYDFAFIEEQIDNWVERIGFPDLVILGGASGVDYLAERWADNNNVKVAVYHDAWQSPRVGLQDSGRDEAGTDLTNKLINAATHILAFPSRTSKWTRVTIQISERLGKNVTVIELGDENQNNSAIPEGGKTILTNGA